jgi:2-oxoisovalerate dehydrogenase E2 component (dihydrolipoyl transacylase)
MDRLMAVRVELNTAGKHIKLTPLPFIVKALSMALVESPQLNGNFNPATNELTLFSHHNIGVAIDTPHGLAIPVIKDVAAMAVYDIARELNRLTELARTNKLPASDIKGATISISNIGTIGGTTASPIIPYPQLAIVALGRTQRVPRFDEKGAVVGVSLMPISWSADHRVVDGATIARFSQRWKQLIETPSQLLV